MIPLFLALSFWLGFLGAEALRLRRSREAILLRISVTGTRGKTSVARLLAAVLREDGRRVLAKTTGSQARVILPDGGEVPVRRRRVASILEQVSFLHRAAREGAEVVVTEIMSVHQENHGVESLRILRPHVVLVTNFRVDHIEAAGATRGEVAALLLSDVVPGATVLAPEGELVPGWSEAVAARGASLIPVPSPEPNPSPEGDSPAAFREILALVRAAAGVLGVDEAAVSRGLTNARRDSGAHWIRRYRSRSGVSALAVNAFAANDPHSTGLLLDWALARTEEDNRDREVLGLLNLRADRGDRSVQWLQAMEAGFAPRFTRLFVMGFHGSAFQRRMRRKGLGQGVRVLRNRDPKEAMERILDTAGAPEPLVFGFGNFGGMGERFVEHWLEGSEALGPPAGTTSRRMAPKREEGGSRGS